MTTEETARAFSSHRFRETYERIAEDTVWTLVGSEPVRGRDAIVAVCEAASQGDEGVTIEWLRFVSTGPGDVVAVDAVGRYSGSEGVSTVSSADVYEFDGDVLVAITSYAVELDDEATRDA